MSKAKTGRTTPRPEPDSGERVISRTLRVAAPPARVWRALTRPSQIALWWPVLATFQAREGKPFHFEWGCSLVARGKVLEARAERRLVLSWTIPELEAGLHATRVAFDLAREGPGTRLTLEHSGFLAASGDDEYFASHVEGWDVDLEELASLCETGEVGTVLVARGALSSDRVLAFDHAVQRLGGHVAERTEDEVVLRFDGPGARLWTRLRIDLGRGRSELVATEAFSASAGLDSKRLYARLRRALRGSVRGLRCGTVYS